MNLNLGRRTREKYVATTTIIRSYSIPFYQRFSRSQSVDKKPYSVRATRIEYVSYLYLNVQHIKNKRIDRQYYNGDYVKRRGVYRDRYDRFYTYKSTCKSLYKLECRWGYSCGLGCEHVYNHKACC